jgi:hypothetical protein
VVRLRGKIIMVEEIFLSQNQVVAVQKRADHGNEYGGLGLRKPFEETSHIIRENAEVPLKSLLHRTGYRGSIASRSAADYRKAENKRNRNIGRTPKHDCPQHPSRNEGADFTGIPGGMGARLAR